MIGGYCMNIQNNTHRPWPIPSNYWIMNQKWRDVLFSHWPVSPEALKPYIPAPLKLDTFDSFGWIGIVLFAMDGIYPRGFPFLSLVPKFAEVNVRTYVHYNGKPGVLFMSLDVGDWASLNIAKRWYHLPYSQANVSYQQKHHVFHFEGRRKEQNNIPVLLRGSFTPHSEIFFPKEGRIDHWVTERYCLYSTDKRGNLFRGEIHHPPWPLQKADVDIIENTLFTPFQLDMEGEKPLSHYSKGVDTVFWNIKKIH